MKEQINKELSQLIVDLDQAIVQAVENPLLFLDSSLIQIIGASCIQLLDLNESHADLTKMQAADDDETERERREALLWQVRSRSGRLQMLLDSAGKFYSSCFSSAPMEGLAYGVHGEWSALETSRHLAVEC